MRVIRTRVPTAFLAILLLAGCAGGGIDDILGRGDPTRVADDVRGTIESLDRANRRIIVDVDQGYRTSLRGAGDEVDIFYDDRTIVQFEGRSYRPEDLERGDRIAAEVDESGGRLVAEQIEVLYDVTSGTSSGTYPGGSTEEVGEVRGEVRYVDTRDATIELVDTTFSRGFDPGTRSGNVLVIHYDASTEVEFQGREYRPENLERGDLVEVEVRDLGNRLLAEEIEVVSDARGGLR
jgi:hypothetical protein